MVLRALQLGDMLCAVPALRAFREAWPEAEITLVGLPWAGAFVSRYEGYLDGFLEFPGWPGLPERQPQIGRIPGFLAEAQARGFDLAIQMHGSGPFVNPITALLGARRCAGFYLPGDYCPDPERFLPWPDEGLEIRRLLRLAEFLGCPSGGEDLEFPIRDADRDALGALVGPGALAEGEYVCVHPGASVPERRWPASHFAAVARELAARGFRVVLTGTAGERELTRAVAEGLGAAALDLSGRTDLGSLAVLLEGARLLACNDTGVSHLAAALRVPSVVVSTGNNPERWAPIDGRRHRVLCDDAGVAPDRVLAEADALLADAPAPVGGPSGLA